MALFNFGKKKSEPKPQGVIPIVLWNKSFKQSGSFRGFRRIRLTIYKEDGVADTLSFYEKNGYNFKDRTIQLQNVRVPDIFGGVNFQVINVYVDGMRIGCVYDTHSSYEMLTANDFDKAHIRVEGEYVYLFVHFIEK